MKKCCLILIAAMLLLLPLTAWAEGDTTPPPLPPEPEYGPLPERYLPLERRALGEWYAEYEGFLFILTFTEDGAYALSAPGVEPQTGKWEVKDGMVVLNGEEAQALLPVCGVLHWDAMGLLFTREKPETYVPAELLADPEEGAMNGYWKAQYVGVGEGAILAQALGDTTELYIEGTKLALGGDRLGNVIRDFTFADGALTLDEEGTTITIQLQQDGLLRLTIEGEAPAVIYLLPAALPGTGPSPEA